MTAAQTLTVSGDEAELRLDRWFKRRFPALGHGRLEKLLRTGQVRVDGKRAKASLRLVPGQQIRVPPGAAAPAPEGAKPARPAVSASDADFVRSLVIYQDDDVLVIDKPAGLAVQGGSGTERHLDAMLDALSLGASDRPRLVHRLDRDTSGVLVLARNTKAAAELTAAFRSKAARKVYWAAVAGAPPRAEGEIALALTKASGPGGERMIAVEEGGRRAVTRYRVVVRAGRRVSWLALEPLTGRTHQVRVHCAALGTPVVGDGKYGGPAARLGGASFARRLHLHARAIRIPRPDGTVIEVTAPLPEHMRATWRFLGFDETEAGNPFADEGG